jgi:hypothetical protein
VKCDQIASRSREWEEKETCFAARLSYFENAVLEQFRMSARTSLSSSHESGGFVAAQVLGYGGIDAFDERNWLLVSRRRRQPFAQQLEKFCDAMQAL